MVFKGAINSVTRARVYYLCNIQGFPIRKVARMCQISKGSVWRIKNEGLLGNKDCKEHIRRGRPVKFKAQETGGSWCEPFKNFERKRAIFPVKE